MKYVVAVSGGVDSVVLLDMLANGTFGQHELVVAHFDHGIRKESADDAQLVKSLAKQYGLPFEMKREELGPNVSEEKARNRRYAFLRGVAKKHRAKIVTAHHADDVVETIAINLTRGTGWRGLAVLDSSDIIRPLLTTTKSELIAYAKKHELRWHEDATNKDTKYLRNNLRRKLDKLDGATKELLRLYRDRQAFLRREVDNESNGLIGASPYARHLFIAAGEPAATELLRAVLQRETGESPTRPQLSRALHAIKTYRADKTFPVGKDARLRFSKTHFVVETEAK